VLLAPALNTHPNPRRLELSITGGPACLGQDGGLDHQGHPSQNVGVSAKHFAANDHEGTEQFNGIAQRRSEIYLRGFEIVVRESQPWTTCPLITLNGLTRQRPAADHRCPAPRLGSWYRDDRLVRWPQRRAQMNAGNDLLEPHCSPDEGDPGARRRIYIVKTAPRPKTPPDRHLQQGEGGEGRIRVGFIGTAR
jgi:beta-glucosidase